MGGVGIARPGTVIQSTVDARWAEQQMAVHNQRRHPQGPAVYHSPYDTDPAHAPPPSLSSHDGFDRPPSSQPTRRAARFRDGLPPPPPPLRPATDAEIAAVLRAANLDPADPRSIDAYAEGVRAGALPTLDDARVILGLARQRANQAAASRLKPQDQFDLQPGRKMAIPSRVASPRYPKPDRPSSLRLETPVLPTPPLPLPNGRAVLESWPGPAMARSNALTPSQRRRLRRKRSREIKEGALVPQHPSIIPDDLLTPEPPETNGHRPAPTPTPGMAVSAPNQQCGTISRVFLPGIEQWLTLGCTITLVPHPGQPHLVQVPTPYLDGASELFIGWFAPGE